MNPGSEYPINLPQGTARLSEWFTTKTEPGHRLYHPSASSSRLWNSNCMVKKSVNFVVRVGADGLDSSHAVLAHIA